MFSRIVTKTIDKERQEKKRLEKKTKGRNPLYYILPLKPIKALP
jgi:hypothetical protein